MPGLGASSDFFSCLGFCSFFSAFFLAFLAAMGSRGGSLAWDGADFFSVEGFSADAALIDVAARDFVSVSTLAADRATTGTQLMGRSLRGSLYS